MAPILLETRSTFLNNNNTNTNNNLWQGLWSDIINAIRPTPSSRTRRSTTTANKVEPLESVTFSQPTTQQQQLFMDSKFQLEYVSFPRLAEEEKELSGDEEDDPVEKTKILDEANIPSRKSCSSVGGSRRRLLGSPWMF